MTVWYVNSEVMHHLWMHLWMRRDSGTNFFQPQTDYMRENLPFFGPEPSYWDDAGTSPIQACEEQGELRKWPQPLQQSFPKTALLEWSFYSVFSAPTMFWCSFILPSRHKVGPSGLSCVFKWLRSLQTQQTGYLCDDTKWAEVRWWGICGH